MSGKKLAFKFSTYIFGYRPLPPYIHLAFTHVMDAPRPSPLFVGLLLPCIVNTKVKRGRPGNEAKVTVKPKQKLEHKTELDKTGYSHVHSTMTTCTNYTDCFECLQGLNP